MVARLPETVALRASLQPVTAPPLEKLRPQQPESPQPREQAAPLASLLLLESNWHFAMGQHVRAVARVETADDSAELIALQSESRLDEPASWVHSFLGQPPVRQAVLLEGLDPKRGQVSQVQGFLLAREQADSSAIIRITITAF